MISLHTSIDDLKSTFECNESGGYSYTLEELQRAIDYEEKHQKRKSVLIFLLRKLNKKIASQNRQSLQQLKTISLAIKKAFK